MGEKYILPFFFPWCEPNIVFKTTESGVIFRNWLHENSSARGIMTIQSTNLLYNLPWSVHVSMNSNKDMNIFKNMVYSIDSEKCYYGILLHSEKLNTDDLYQLFETSPLQKRLSCKVLHSPNRWTTWIYQ